MFRFICSLCALISFSAYGFTLRFSPSDLSFYEDSGWNRVKAEGFFSTCEPGAPELPVKYLNYILPPANQAESIVIISERVEELPGEYRIYPVQAHTDRRANRFTEPDLAIYESENPYPSVSVRLTHQGGMDGAEITGLAFYPLRYYPERRRLAVVTEITFEFRLRTKEELRHPRIRGENAQRYYDWAMERIVENDRDIFPYYRRPRLIPEREFYSTARSCTSSLIICPRDFVAAYDSLRIWLHSAGFPTIIWPIEDVYEQYPPIPDSAAALRQFLQMAWEYWGTGWVLLGGDDDSGMPLRYGTPHPTNPSIENFIPTDLYFGDLDGNWDADGDERYGEIGQDSANPYPEVFVGRVLARNIVEAVQWRRKRDIYSFDPPNRERLDHFLGIANHDNNFAGLLELYTECIAPNPDSLRCCIDADSAVDLLNMGYGLCAIYADGEIPGYASSSFESRLPIPSAHVWGYHPDNNVRNSGLNYLSTYDEHYIVFTASTCWAAEFDNMRYEYGLNPTLADGFIDAYERTGAVAFMGSTRGYSVRDHDLAMEFWGSLMREPRIQIGEHYAAAKTEFGDFDIPDVRRTAYCHNLFGNPLMRVWTTVPGFMYATFPHNINTGDQPFLVAVRDAQTHQGVPYTDVCLWKDFDFYDVGVTDGNGHVLFQISPRSPGVIRVTCTHYHTNPRTYLPYRDSSIVGGRFTYSGTEEQANRTDSPLSLAILSYSSIIKGKLQLRYSVPCQSPVDITFYNPLGAKVFSRRLKPPTKGYHDLTLPLSTSSGIYWIELRQDNSLVRKKVVILK